MKGLGQRTGSDIAADKAVKGIKIAGIDTSVRFDHILGTAKAIDAAGGDEPPADIRDESKKPTLI